MYLIKYDYRLLTSDSQEKVFVLVNDLLDVCQEQDSTVFAELCHLQPGILQTSTNREKQAFYEEIIELLSPAWYEVFVREQKRRQITSKPSGLITYQKPTTKTNKKSHAFSRRRSLVRVTFFSPLIIEHYTS